MVLRLGDRATHFRPSILFETPQDCSRILEVVTAILLLLDLTMFEDGSKLRQIRWGVLVMIGQDAPTVSFLSHSQRY